MDDVQIIELYWARSDRAIEESAVKYGRYCHTIAYNILRSDEDSEECVNDTWLNAWNAIPPKHPSPLSAFLGRITRNLALNRWKRSKADKRGGGQVELALEELSGCIPSADSPAQAVEDAAVVELLDGFLGALPPQTRKIFMLRYWYLCPVGEIARLLGVGESKVKMTLMRSRSRLRELLEKEGVTL